MINPMVAEEEAVGLPPKKHARAVFVGAALRAEVLEGAVGLSEGTGDLPEGVDPALHGIGAEIAGCVAHVLALAPADEMKQLAPARGELDANLTAVVLSRPALDEPRGCEGVDDLSNGRPGHAEEPGDACGGLLTTLAEKAEHTDPGGGQRLAKGSEDGATFKDVLRGAGEDGQRPEEALDLGDAERAGAGGLRSVALGIGHATQLLRQHTV